MIIILKHTIYSLQVSLNSCFSFLFYYADDKCIIDYLGSLGTKERILLAPIRPCRHIVRSNKDTWLRLWFEPITSKEGNFIITLKDFRGKERINNTWDLSPGNSKHTRNFGAVEKGDRFEIQEQSYAYNQWRFDLRFMLYSAGKDEYNIRYYLLLGLIRLSVTMFSRSSKFT